MNQRKHTLKGLLMRLGVVLMLCALFSASFAPALAQTGPTTSTATGAHHKVVPQQVGQPNQKPRPQKAVNRAKPARPAPKTGAPTLAAALPNHSLDPRLMKVLLINTDTAANPDYDYEAMSAFLNQAGIPFDSFNATTATLTDSVLWDGVSQGNYQGIILTSGSLVYYDSGSNTWPSAFTDAEWQILWNYEAMFGVRQLTTYTMPGWPDSYGLSDPTYAYQDTSVTPLQAQLTADGKTVFSYLNPNSPITIRYAWTYLATVAPGETVTPLLTAVSGATTYTLAAVKKYTNGRENLALTAQNNSFLIHSQLFSYGLLNWVTKGAFLGERHVTMDIQPDDLLTEDDIWNTTAMTDTTGITYRLTGPDFTKFIAWQNSVRTKYPLAANLKIEWPFNAEGASGIYSNDTLTPAVKANRTAFNWINHTYTHQNLDNATAYQVQTELLKDTLFANSNRLTPYYPDSMIQPDISGLNSPTFQKSAYNMGIRYIISDASAAGWNNPSPNAGFYSNLQPNLLIIPRKASSLFYNLVTPDQWVSEYNCYYGPTGTCANGTWRYWDHNLTYSEILNDESDFLVSYMLTWNIDPVMFHQPNTAPYDGTHTLLGDLLEAALTKYTAMYNLPIVNLTLHDVGKRMASRMAYDSSGAKGILYPGQKIVLSVTKAATVPITGLAYGTNKEVYGGQNISYVSLAANQVITLPIS